MADAAPLLSVRALKKYFPIERGLLRRIAGYVKAVDDVSSGQSVEEEHEAHRDPMVKFERGEHAVRPVWYLGFRIRRRIA